MFTKKNNFRCLTANKQFGKSVTDGWKLSPRMTRIEIARDSYCGLDN